MKIKVLGLVAALCVSACAAPYVATPYDRASAGVARIAVIDDAAEDDAIAYEVASMGSNFGLVGALIDAGIQAERRAALNRALDGAEFDAEARLEAILAERLASQGYQVATLDNGARAKRDFLKTYPAAEGHDAYLDVVVMNYGYLSAGAFQPFRPHASAMVRLVSAADPDRVLMDNRIVYNGMDVADGVIALSPDPSFEFQNREQLLAEPERTAAGIEHALSEIADTAARLLR